MMVAVLLEGFFQDRDRSGHQLLHRVAIGQIIDAVVVCQVNPGLLVRNFGRETEGALFGQGNKLTDLTQIAVKKVFLGFGQLAHDGGHLVRFQLELRGNFAPRGVAKGVNRLGRGPGNGFRPGSISP